MNNCLPTLRGWFNRCKKKIFATQPPTAYGYENQWLAVILFVDEARRGLTCDVLTTDQREQAELADFSNAEICSKATHESSKGPRLSVDLDSEKFIREAGRRSQSCVSFTNEFVDLNVAQIQTRLHQLGYDPGLIDGAWGGKQIEPLKSSYRFMHKRI